MSKLIYLDPGHGENDPGALLGKRYEKNDNFRLAQSVRKKLQAQGHTVLMTRESDTNPSLEARSVAARLAKADLFISLHRNSFPDPTAKGIEIWVRYINHAAVAGIVLEELAKLPNQANRGVKIGAYRVLYNAPMPAMLLELGFISNTKDNELFDTHFDDYAAAISKGIVSALGEEWQDDKPSQAAKPLYRIQVGAFESRGNAEAFLKYVQEDRGLPAFMISIDRNLAEPE
jgi:N-acetylmuramoyl-L-alanine amidase